MGVGGGEYTVGGRLDDMVYLIGSIYYGWPLWGFNFMSYPSFSCHSDL